MPKVSEKYKAQKRKLILESALQCFSEKGYHTTTMDDIAAYSKTSKGLIYHYFKSKEELYIALMEERTEAAFLVMKERFQTIETATGKMKEWFRIYQEVKSSSEWQAMIRVHMEFWINSARYENIKNIMINRYKEQYINSIQNIIEEGKENGEFHKHIDSYVMASFFWGSIDGLSLHYSVVGEDRLYRESLKKSEEMMLGYLQIPPLNS
ncbi:TetR/AcrR family transcriptional regulator [Bacillus sp. 165]|uniref:TetR/AcrR family transcriptional regulator n=1 Tax=Bacillus sp. 165 TaxID=1529117 RepID=UPI001ADB69D2|nr:TetR/AcrR family transcriptional regulator [Bacillus sp. 165]MBO9130760.1 TetR/AcrR family transcriptional regulator [Bacillus sp. 165]